MAHSSSSMTFGTLFIAVCACRPVGAGATESAASEPAPATVAPAKPSPPDPRQPTKLIEITRGTFRMGDDDGTARERPAHDVQVATFYLEEHEVTAAQYLACVEAQKCTPPGEKGNYGGLKMDKGTPELLDLGCTGYDPARLGHPITCVDWNQAEAYCAWIGRRLPTEEEWEYAARGPASRTFVWGEDESLEQGGANTRDQAFARWAESRHIDRGGAKQDDGYPLTAPPKKFPRDVTPEGVFDLAGNVTEWTSSNYCSYREAKCSTYEKVARGFAWDSAHALPASSRGGVAPHVSLGAIGLRCAQTQSHTLDQRRDLR